MRQSFFFTCLLLCLSAKTILAATDKVVCYYGSWAHYRPDKGQFGIQNLDPNLCTHLIYSFIDLGEDGNVQHHDTNLNLDLENIKRFNNLRLLNKNLKTLVALGGWNEGSEKYSVVAADPVKRATLVRSIVSFLQTWGFDGFDLDWEYPAQRGGAAADKENYVILLKELRAEFDKHGFLLTAAVAAAAGSVDISYDVPSLSKYLDLINVMTYDLHGPWDPVTGQNAPLYASSSETEKLLNVDAAIRGWIDRGADPQKISLGLGVYGRSYTLSDANNHGLGAPIVGAGNQGNYTGEPGMLGYNEIVELQLEGGWTTVWDDEQKTPYIYKGGQWVGFDNPKSISIKANYAKSLNLAAVMIWSIETDDFLGTGGTSFPILKAIHEALGIGGSNSGDANSDSGNDNSESESVTKASPTSSSTVPVAAGAAAVCTAAGYVRDPVVCSRFYYCLAHQGTFVPLELNCAYGLVFEPATIACNYPHLVKC